MNTDTKTDVYQIITDRILALLDAGVNPWRKPWHAAAWKPPQNLLSRRPYRGVNVLLLGLSPYSSPYWVSFKQALQARVVFGIQPHQPTKTAECGQCVVAGKGKAHGLILHAQITLRQD